jgi:hypothetical protein
MQSLRGQIYWTMVSAILLHNRHFQMRLLRPTPHPDDGQAYGMNDGPFLLF